MKFLTVFILSLIFSNSFSQEIRVEEIKSEVNEVTVFIDGAQVIRKRKSIYSRENRY